MQIRHEAADAAVVVVFEGDDVFADAEIGRLKLQNRRHGPFGAPRCVDFAAIEIGVADGVVAHALQKYFGWNGLAIEFLTDEMDARRVEITLWRGHGGGVMRCVFVITTWL